MCRRSPPIACADSRGAFWFQPNCDSWQCPECGPRLRARWLALAARRFGPWVFVSSGRDADWDAVIARMRRRGADWLRTDHGDTTWTSYSTTAETLSGRWTTKAEALAQLEHDLERIERPAHARRFTPVTTSAGWRPEPRASRAVLLGWMTRGSFVREMARAGARVAERASGAVRYLRAFLGGERLEALCRLFGARSPKEDWPRNDASPRRPLPAGQPAPAFQPTG